MRVVQIHRRHLLWCMRDAVSEISPNTELWQLFEFIKRFIGLDRVNYNLIIIAKIQTQIA